MTDKYLHIYCPQGDTPGYEGNCGTASINNLFQKTMVKDHLDIAVKYYNEQVWKRAMEQWPKDTLRHWQKRQEYYNDNARHESENPGIGPTVLKKYLEEKLGLEVTEVQNIPQMTVSAATKIENAIIGWVWPDGSGHWTAYKKGQRRTSRGGWLLDSNEDDKTKFDWMDQIDYPDAGGKAFIDNIFDISGRGLTRTTGLNARYNRFKLRNQGRDRPY